MAWMNEDPPPGESVVYQQGMTCYDDGPEVLDVYEAETIRIA